MTLPTLQLLLDNGTGTFPHDITSKVMVADGRGYSFDRGRQDWQGGVTAGSLSLTLDNSDGRFTPGSTIIATPSPIRVDQQIRLLESLVANTTFETDVSGYTGSNATLARSTAQAHSGAASMSITATTAATALAVDSGSGVGGIPVTGGATYPFKAWTRAATTARLTQIRVDWWDAAGVFISTTLGTSTSDTTTGWTALSETFVAPSNAAYARRQLLVINPAAGEVHYVDDFEFWTRRSTGSVKSWPVAWPATVPTFSLVTITATDAQARAERRILRSIIEEEVRLDSPSADYTLGEPAGATSAYDSSGNQAPPLTMTGTGTDVVFGNATGPGTDGLTAATFAGGRRLQATLASTPVLLECWFATTTNDAVDRTLLGTKTVAGPAVTNGNLTFAGSGSAGAVADGLEHHVAWTGTSVYLDGVLTGLGATAPGDATLVVGQAFIGSMAHVAAYAVAPSAARIAAHYQSGTTGFAGESGSARLTRLAGYAGIPLGTLDTSLTNVAFVDITGTSAWEAIQQVADAELGLVYVDGSGNLTFHNRNRVVAKAVPDLTLTADYVTPDVSPVDDDQQILNYLDVTAEGTQVTQNVRDAVSEEGDGTPTHPGHGRYSDAKSYLVATDAEALDRGNWIIANFAEPTTRYGTLTINLYKMTAAQAAAVVATLEPDCWLRVTGAPSQNTTGSTIDVVVEGIAPEVSGDSWRITCNVVSRSLFSPVWILGDLTQSVLGSTTRLYV